MPISNAPVIGGNQNLTDVLFNVTKAWESWQSTTPTLAGWHLISGAELGMESAQLLNGVYQNSNAEAIVAAATYNGHRTLAIGFRGTNDQEDWRQDFQNINEHFTLFTPLITALNAVIARGEFDLVLVTGHSLGGAMTQMFMAEYAGKAPAYAITTGSPGYLQNAAVADPRVINYQVTDDPIIYLGAERAAVGQILGGPLGASMLGQLANVLSSSFGFPASTFTNSVPFFTKNYSSRGTIEVLKVPGHPDSAPSSLLSLMTSYNAAAHDFSTYQKGLAQVNGNPFDLSAGSRGTSGNDALFGTTGNDSIDGGAGYDTLYLHVSRSSAALTLGPNGPVQVASPQSGVDTLVSVERLVFTDKRLAFDLGADQSAGMAVRLIGAAFDAAAITANPGWVGEGVKLFDQGVKLLDVSNTVAEMMGNSDNADFVNTVYRNVVGTLPSADELQTFVSMLEGSGGNISKGQLLEMAALVDVNEVNIGLIGLQTTGVEFI
jgi:pimeloyl-ACP methyl ester carboxylesterase